MLGALARRRHGVTLALAGVAVVVTDQQADPVAGALAVIDMSGPAAALSEFARTHNVVISAWPAPGVGRSEYLAAVRLAALKAAVYLAQAARDVEAETVEVFELPPSPRVPAALAHLPRVAYVFQIHSHQRPTGVDEGILYGDPVRRMLPTMVHPNEILDGAVVRGFMGRNATTWATQNHPVIRSLYAQHGARCGSPASSSPSRRPPSPSACARRSSPPGWWRTRSAPTAPCSPRSAAARRTWTWRRRPRNAKRSA